MRWIVTSRRAGNAAPVNVLKYLLYVVESFLGGSAKVTLAPVKRTLKANSFKFTQARPFAPPENGFKLTGKRLFSQRPVFRKQAAFLAASVNSQTSARDLSPALPRTTLTTFPGP